MYRSLDLLLAVIARRTEGRATHLVLENDDSCFLVKQGRIQILLMQGWILGVLVSPAHFKGDISWDDHVQ